MHNQKIVEINKNNISLALKSASFPVLAATLVHIVGDIKILDNLPKPRMATLGEIQGYFTKQEKEEIAVSYTHLTLQTTPYV